jgi:hypothetical protein
MQPTAPNDDTSVHGPMQGPVERENARAADDSDSPNSPIVTTFGVLPPVGELVSRLFHGARRAVMGLCGLVRLASELVTLRAVVISVAIVVVLPTLLWWFA